MNKCAAFTAIAALAGQLITSAFAAAPFPGTTMFDQQRVAAPAVMAYMRMPLQSVKSTAFQPRAGLMITSPQAYRVGDSFSRTSAPGMLDLGFTARDLASPWTATFNVGGAVAWAQDPKALPKNTRNLFESGTSWVVVGLLSAGIIGGVYALSDRGK